LEGAMVGGPKVWEVVLFLSSLAGSII